MNTEELKQLNPGDDIFIRAKFKNILEDGDVAFTHTYTNQDDDVVKTEEYTHPDNIVLSPSAPKYDPFRLFKKGDRVRVVERYGRKFWRAAPKTIYTVAEDEYLHDDQNVPLRGCVGINDGKPETLSAWNIPFFLIELVTPVEELEPYFTKESREKLWWEVWKRVEEEGGLLVALFNTGEHPNPKAAAEAECKRLNAEYRKEQNNGNK